MLKGAIDDGRRGEAESADTRRRLLLAGVLTVPVFVLSMGTMLFASHLGRSMPWIQLALSAPVVVWAGARFFGAAWESVKRRQVNMSTLIALSIGVSWGVSVVATVFPSVFPEAFHDSHGAAPLYFEGAAMMVTLALVGRLLDQRAVRLTDAATGAVPPAPLPSDSRVSVAETETATRLGRGAQRGQSDAHDLIDKWVARVVLAMLVLAAVTFSAWMVLGAGAGMAFAILTAVAVVVVASPCTVCLAAPLALAVQARRLGGLSGEIEGVDLGARLGEATMRTVRQNLFLAFFYNVLLLPLAAGALYPSYGWLLTPMVASAAMMVSLASVLLNSWRLKRLPLN